MCVILIRICKEYAYGDCMIRKSYFVKTFERILRSAKVIPSLRKLQKRLEKSQKRPLEKQRAFEELFIFFLSSRKNIYLKLKLMSENNGNLMHKTVKSKLKHHD